MGETALKPKPAQTADSSISGYFFISPLCTTGYIRYHFYSNSATNEQSIRNPVARWAKERRGRRGAPFMPSQEGDPCGQWSEEERRERGWLHRCTYSDGARQTPPYHRTLESRLHAQILCGCIRKACYVGFESWKKLPF